MRSSKSRSRIKQHRPPTLGNIINRVFDSSGPDGKVRGMPQQIIEKYQHLARDAQLSNDRVGAENFLQHAEHYTRLLAEAQREMAAEQQERQQQYQQQQERRPRSHERGEYSGEQHRITDLVEVVVDLSEAPPRAPFDVVEVQSESQLAVSAEPVKNKRRRPDDRPDGRPSEAAGDLADDKPKRPRPPRKPRPSVEVSAPSVPPEG